MRDVHTETERKTREIEEKELWEINERESILKLLPTKSHLKEREREIVLSSVSKKIKRKREVNVVASCPHVDRV